MKQLLFAFLIICTFSCNQTDFGHPYKPSEKQNLANAIRKKAAKQIKEELGLYPSGTGGQMMYDIQMLALAFNYYKPITVEEGRELLIRAVDIFVDAVNADERIRPYLANYPFEPKNIQIRIFLRNPNGSNPPMGELAVISAIDEILEYEIDTPSDPLFVTVHKETYKTALTRPVVGSIKYPKERKIKPIVNDGSKRIGFCG